MQLISLWVDGYKNLLDTQVEFSGGNIPIAIIGNNGTGKSNLIEAIFNIFIKIYFGEAPAFSFKLIYEAHDKRVEVSKIGTATECTISVNGYPWSKSRFKEMAQSPGLRPPFPELIFGYYSGTSLRLRQLFNRYNHFYSLKLKNKTADLARSFVFSDSTQADFILLGLLAHKHFELLNATSVAQLASLTITIQSPKNYNNEIDDPKFWGITGGLRYFLADLDIAAKNESATQFLILDLNAALQRSYRFDQESWEKVGHYSRAREANVFSMLLALKMAKILVSVDFTLAHTNGSATLHLDDLSEGEKQLISVIGGLHLTLPKECLILLDEPDTHLNPAWTWQYASLLKKALASEKKVNSTVLITTHNPILISGLTKEQVLIARKENNQLKYEQPVRDPRGQGIANVLCSEFFGLPSSLDEYTQGLIDERLILAYAEKRLRPEEALRLKQINSELNSLGLSISFRDPEYKKFEESKYKKRLDN